MAHYPKLKKKLGLIGAFCLIVWGTFILAMQLYVFGYYSNQYGEGTGSRNWGDAYTGMVLANSAASLIFGLYYVVVFAEKATTTKLLLWGMILVVIGTFAAAGSTVLAALEADWVKVSANVDSTHPCRFSNISEAKPIYPSELICTNWFALEVTVAVLSGLAFSEYIFIGVVIFLGMSAAKSFADNLMDSPVNRSLDSIIPQARIGTTTTTNNNNNNNPQTRAGQDGPYNAFHYSPPPSAKTPAMSQQSYDDLNPQYGYHLQQLSLQQQHQKQQQQQQQPKPPAAPSVYQPVREAPSVPSNANSNAAPMNRGRLQVLHNQRQRPAAPPVPAKPGPNNSSLYRY